MLIKVTTAVLPVPPCNSLYEALSPEILKSLFAVNVAICVLKLFLHLSFKTSFLALLCTLPLQRSGQTA